ncbi:MAG: CPXCG motif-containing cysteine-rich protein [Gammaproteobacteria bacterium]
MLDTQNVSCPYCGETFDTAIDASAGTQDYIEDCYVCCRPIRFVIQVDHNGELARVETLRDDE